MSLRTKLRAPLLGLFVLCAGCTYPQDADPRRGDDRGDGGDHFPALYAIADLTPAPGSTGIPRDTAVVLTGTEPPDARTVTARAVRVFAGLGEFSGTLSVDLLARTITLVPGSLLRPDLRHQVFVSGAVRGLSGRKVGDNLVNTFTTGDRVGGASPPVTPTVRAADLQPVWDRGCVSCHGGGEPAMGLSLVTPAAAVQSLVGVPAQSGGYHRVVSGIHAKSYLLLKLMNEGGITGRPMPPAGPPMDRATLRRVARWIDGGALP